MGLFWFNFLSMPVEQRGGFFCLSFNLRKCKGIWKWQHQLVVWDVWLLTKWSLGMLAGEVKRCSFLSPSIYYNIIATSSERFLFSWEAMSNRCTRTAQKVAQNGRWLGLLQTVASKQEERPTMANVPLSIYARCTRLSKEAAGESLAH